MSRAEMARQSEYDQERGGRSIGEVKNTAQGLGASSIEAPASARVSKDGADNQARSSPTEGAGAAGIGNLCSCPCEQPGPWQGAGLGSRRDSGSATTGMTGPGSPDLVALFGAGILTR
jgi:hypothetical protein